MTSLDQEQLRTFGEDGVLGPLPLSNPLDPSLVGHMLELSETDSPIWQVPNQGRAPWFNVKTYGRVRDRHLESRRVFEVATDPGIIGRVQSILGPDLLLWRTQLFVNRKLQEKELRFYDRFATPQLREAAVQRNTVWHQGGGFAGATGVPALVPPVGVTVWLTLTKTNMENGTLEFLPGTHRLGLVPVVPAGAGRFVNDGLGYNLDYSRSVPVVAQPGEFVMFNEFVVHGSRRSPTEEPRVALACRFTAPTTHVFPELYEHAENRHLGDMPDPGLTGLDFPAVKLPRRTRELDNWGLPLKNWGCVLVAGEDRCGFNRLVSPPA